MRNSSATTAYTGKRVPAWSFRFQRHLAALDLPDAAAYRNWCRAHGFGPALRKTWQQRHEEQLRARKLAEEAQRASELKRHLAKIGLRDPEEYRSWCVRHGYGAALHKGVPRRNQEQQTAERERASAALVQARTLRRRPEDFVRAVFDGSLGGSDLRSDGEREFACVIGALKQSGTRDAMRRLLLRFGMDIETLTLRPAVAHLGWGQYNSFLKALLRVAERYREWLREPESWKPAFGSPRRRFSALVRHLFAKYPTPMFMDAAWFAESNTQARLHQSWFLHVAQGQNLRSAAVPLALTKRMAHHALKAPSDFSIVAALRWGQVIGMGGTVRLARAVLATRLGEIQVDEPFWATVVQFFVNSPMLDTAQLGSIVDYLYHHKFVPREVRGLNGQVECAGPPQPDLMMKGRSATALVRLVEEWHRQLAWEKRPAREWARSGIVEFELCQERVGQDVEIWTIQELLSTRELHQEGRYMHNCVATYAGSCLQGECSLWSMRKRTKYERLAVRIMTIEVTNGIRQVVQARGRYNYTPDQACASADLKAAPQVLKCWARHAQLTISEHAW